MRGTPLPPWLYIAGRIGSACYLAAIAAAIMLGVGIIVFGVQLYPEAIPSLLVTFAVGVACWSALGMLAAAVSPSGDAAPAITNATLLPLAFISDVFIPPGANTPAWLSTLADIFPLKPFAVAFQDAFNPQVVAAADSWLDLFHWAELGVMVVWGVAGVLLAVRLFRWEPKGGERVGQACQGDGGGAGRDLGVRTVRRARPAAPGRARRAGPPWSRPPGCRGRSRAGRRPAPPNGQ